MVIFIAADETLHNLAELAYGKQELAKKNPFKYHTRSFFAGLFIIVGVIASNCTGALLFSIDSGIARFGNAITMSVALILITFIGGELFTGINFVMSCGLYTKRCSLAGVLRVWLYCWLGNFVACVVLGLIFVLSDTHSEPLRIYMTATVIPKLELDWLTLIVRGIFANFCVCCGVLASLKMKSESGKIIVIIFCVFAFIVGGFEHCIANIGTFVVAAFYADGFEIIPALVNLLFSTIGNILGGAVVLGLPYYLVYKE